MANSPLFVQLFRSLKRKVSGCEPDLEEEKDADLTARDRCHSVTSVDSGFCETSSLGLDPETGLEIISLAEVRLIGQVCWSN